MSRIHLIALVVLVGIPSLSRAQEEEPPALRVDWVRAGFQSYAVGDGFPRFKVGMWTPVYVKLTAGKKGFPEKGDARTTIKLETNDSEDVGTIYTVAVGKLDPKESRTVLAYTRTGNLSSEIKVSVLSDGRSVLTENANARTPGLGSLLVLTLGGTVEGLQDAMTLMNALPRDGGIPVGGEFDLATRFAGYESQVGALPELGFGYDSADLMILCTGTKKFLQDLRDEPSGARIRALSYYVRNGGHLVIPVAWENQEILHKVLTSPAWQPAIPVVPPADAGDIEARRLDQLSEIRDWAGEGLAGKRFPAAGKVIIAKLDPGKVAPGVWDVVTAHAAGNIPIITRVPYGLGNIIYIAFPLDEAPFKDWEGRAEFLKSLVNKLTPRVAVRRDLHERRDNDVAAELQRSMDQFDVQVVPFGLVALFIIIYILIVGPLDYFVLKYVFGKLEWTWFTFPAVVLIVSVAAYYTAYALKGNDQKVNQIDIIDFDLRTELDESFAPRRAHVYGQSFFTLLSPRIQAYTVGLKPNPAFLGVEDKALASARPVTWLGRPDPEAWGMGRRGSQGLFRKPYRYAGDAEGLEKVPVAVWTTKSFRASWEAPLPALPFEAKLTIDDDKFIAGTFKNNLPVELLDVWFIYRGLCFKYPNPIQGGGKEVNISLRDRIDINAWATAGEPAGVAVPMPGVGSRSSTAAVKTILFQDRLGFGSKLNHLLRNLDQSWRVEAERPGFGPPPLREVIVYARLKQRHGPAQDLASDAAQPLPTQLWLGALPGSPGASRPELLGTMTHDTYIRIYLPLLPAAK